MIQWAAIENALQAAVIAAIGSAAAQPWRPRMNVASGSSTVSNRGLLFRAAANGTTWNGPDVSSGTQADAGTLVWTFQCALGTPFGYQASHDYSANALVASGNADGVFWLLPGGGTTTTAASFPPFPSPGQSFADPAGNAWVAVLPWRPGTGYLASASQFVFTGAGRVYLCTTSGTSYSGPTAASGTDSSDPGGLAWTAVGPGGLDPQHVIWEFQQLPRPTRPYATLQRVSFRDLSERDERRFSFDGSQPAGQEVGISTFGPRELTVRAQCFSDVVTGAGTALELAEDLRSGLSLPAITEALWEAGLSIVSRGATQDLTALVETAFESRAALDLTLALADSVTDRTGYVATADVTGSVAP